MGGGVSIQMRNDVLQEFKAIALDENVVKCDTDLGKKIVQSAEFLISKHGLSLRTENEIQSKFMDSAFFKKWLNNSEADELFQHLNELGKLERERSNILSNRVSTKYPLWTTYYGFRRNKDGARALDKWGSYHESWIRVLEPSKGLETICEKIRKHFSLRSEAG
jgi:hypothetical protein